jgi:hypothetical protein
LQDSISKLATTKIDWRCALRGRAPALQADSPKSHKKKKRKRKKLNTELSHSSATPLLDTHPRELKSVCQRNIYTCMFITGIFTITKIWNKARCLVVDE